jgi:hypothetical protein
MSVGAVTSREERPAYVRFERVPIEDKQASLKAGHYVAKDVDFALITPPYSKDVYKTKVTQWFVNMDQDVQNGRLRQEWADQYKKSYEHWKNGQEIPLNGTAIKGWGVISPAQQEILLKMNVLTVEDLAGINDEGLRRIGMGSMDWKNKAVAWLAQLKDKGPLTQEVAALKSENVLLKTTVDSLTAKVHELSESIKSKQVQLTQNYEPPVEVITAADILETPVQQYEKKFGKPPDGRWSEAKIVEALK